VAALFAVILGNTELLGVRVKKGRVAYVALENPTDLRMKLEVARFTDRASRRAFRAGRCASDEKRRGGRVDPLWRGQRYK
jgi:hypothetical protein